MKKLITAVGISGVMLALPLIALAAKPNNQACLGHDFSGYAKASQPFGQVITTFPVNGIPIIEGGIGAEVQNHLAGNVPDSVLPNSCND
jgi:hypothetical protein